MRILHDKKLIFVSKPRCGSTSLRKVLNQSMGAKDIKVDVAGERDGLHPHMSAPAVHDYLIKNDIDPSEYTTLIVTRHPIDMLWSYFKFFKPDVNSRYYYSPDYAPDSLMDFDSWLKSGKVGIGDAWKTFVPNYITDNNLSPLSLDAHILDKEGRNYATEILRIEDSESINSFLRKHSLINEDAVIERTNSSLGKKELPSIDDETVFKLHKELPMDFELYENL